MELIEQAPNLVKHAEALHEMARAKWDEVALVTGVVKGGERETIFKRGRVSGYNTG
jgi:ERCC4-related helicase